MRTVALVLVDPSGALLGALPPVEFGTPWWQEVSEVVDAVAADVTVLRLLHGDRPAPPGGRRSSPTSPRCSGWSTRWRRGW